MLLMHVSCKQEALLNSKSLPDQKSIFFYFFKLAMNGLLFDCFNPNSNPAYIPAKQLRNLQFLNMNSDSRCFYIIKFILSLLFVNCNTLLQKSAKKDILFLEAGRGDELLHLKFKFPSFDEFRRIRDDSCNLKLSSSALIE
ncbi:hypothetical protein AAHA92_05624 [Salvia divinorum]|uniref:Uncharacterized protein n=1 Tax=Salvia divinorum TaxID=28513 RepID=A0ABD1I316_SALDI